MLEQRLGNWQQWHLPLLSQPTVLHELLGGRTNRSFVCTATVARPDTKQPAKQKLVVRINSPISSTLGINREHEAKILAQAAEAGIAPAFYYSDDQILVTEFLEGRTWSSNDFQQPNNYKKLAALLKTVHDLNLKLPAFDYYHHAENYWQALINAGAPVADELVELRKHCLPLVKAFQASIGQRVVCHHDLVPANIIEHNGQLKLIDWEYAGLGSASFDWACLLAEGVSLPEINAKKAHTAQQVYTYIGRLWEALNQPLTQPSKSPE